MASISAGSVTDRDKRELQAIGVWQVGVSASNKRKVSGAMLSPPSSSDSSLSSSSSITVVFRDDTGIANCDFDMAMEQESVDALIYIGFSEDPATEIWTRYQGDDSDSPYDLMGYVRGYIEGCDIGGLGDRAALTKMGLSTNFKDRILKPDYFAILRTQELKYWVLEFLDSNFQLIGVLLERSRNWAARSLRAKNSTRKSLSDINWNPDTVASRPGGGSKSLSAIDFKSDVTQRSGGSKPAASKAGSSKAAASSKATKLTTAVTATGIENTLDNFNLPAAHVSAVTTWPQPRAGHITLYKAIPGVRCKNWIQSDGSFDVQGLVTQPGGDFNGRNLAFYWSRELATAEKHRAWQAYNIRNGDIWIISVQIPAAWLTGGGCTYRTLIYSNPWKHYVWRCKKQRRPREKEEPLLTADVIYGYICTGRPDIITIIAEADIETATTRENLLKNGNDPCTQDCVMNHQTMETIFQLAGGAHVDVMVAGNPQGAQQSKGKGKAN